MALDTLVNRLLFSARLLERLVYDPQPWTAKWDDIDVPLKKVLLDEGVTLSVVIPPSPKTASLDIFCGDELVISRQVTGSGSFGIFEWDFIPSVQAEVA